MNPAKEPRRRRTGLIVALGIALFAGYLLWSTLGRQRTSCDVCVEFAGARNCATASGMDESEARQTAQRTACGPVAAGMDASIACANRPPVSSRCSTR